MGARLRAHVVTASEGREREDLNLLRACTGRLPKDVKVREGTGPYVTISRY